MDKDKKPFNASSSSVQDSAAIPSVGPNNRALEEIHHQFSPEMRRAKPDQQAIAAALQAMRRLTMDADVENSAEESVAGSESSVLLCRTCGQSNRKDNKFCGACGMALGGEPGLPDAVVNSESALMDAIQEEISSMASPEMREVHPANPSAAVHHYHHHYHHHYFQGGVDAGAYSPIPRAANLESAREADRLRVAAAAKGEPMSRGEAAVRRLTQEWVLACNTRQLDELIELYSPDALVLRTNLPTIRGTIALREFFHGALEAGLGEVALDPIRIEVAGDLAHEVGRYSALVPGTAGKRREDRGKYLWVFARQSGGDWKLASECWSSDLTLSDAESDFAKPVVPVGKPRK